MGWRFVEADLRIVESARVAAATGGWSVMGRPQATGARMLFQPMADPRFGVGPRCEHQIAGPVPMFTNLALKIEKQRFSRLRA
jgi:hypothetical protein